MTEEIRGESTRQGIGRRLASMVRARERTSATSTTAHVRIPSTASPRPRSGVGGAARGSSSHFVQRPSRARKHDLPDWLRRTGLGAWALIGIIIVISMIVLGLAKISAVFVAIFVALLLTAILNPVVDFLSRWMKRWIAVILSLLGFFGIFFGLLTLVVTSVVGQWGDLTRQFGDGVNRIIYFLQTTPFHLKLTPTDVDVWMSSMVAKGQSYVAANWGSLASDVLSNVSVVALAFTILALAIFVTIFFLHSGSQMWRWFLNWLPSRYRGTVHRAASAGWYTFSGYARGTMLVAGTDGLLAGIYLSILHVPVAPALGILVFIGAFIPLVGAPVAMVVAMVVAFASGGLVQAALVGLGIAGIGQLEGHVFQPLIMGRQVSLHPVVVIVGVAIGTFTAGLLGAVIAIPIIAVIWSIFSTLYEPDDPIEGPLPDYSRTKS